MIVIGAISQFLPHESVWKSEVQRRRRKLGQGPLQAASVLPAWKGRMSQATLNDTPTKISNLRPNAKCYIW
jgi:hypothetical protein